MFIDDVDLEHTTGFKESMGYYFDVADLGEIDEAFSTEGLAYVIDLGVGEGSVAVPVLEPGILGPFLEEILVGRVQAAKNVLQHLGVNSLVFRVLFFESGQAILLHRIGKALAGFFVSGDPLFEGPVIEMPAKFQGVEHFLFLLGRGSDLEAVDEDQEITFFSETCVCKIIVLSAMRQDKPFIPFLRGRGLLAHNC
jgi:hypothetical protein